MKLIGRLPLLMYGLLFCALGTVMYTVGILMVFPRYLFVLNRFLLPLNEWIVWYSGVPMLIGFTLSLADLFILLPLKRSADSHAFRSHRNSKVVVSLTAFNDEASIGDTVEDFLRHPMVTAVIVVSNNSTDGTLPRARQAGAMVYNEVKQGYGHCVYRCLEEGLHYEGVDLIVLCEGDRTFRAYDLDKLLAYLPHADIVNGTRTVEPLRQYRTQLSTFMYYGNFFVGKLLEAKHLGRGTITDVGTTYKLCRKEAVAKLLPVLNASINLEFNAHFLDLALAHGLRLVECPVTFHPRVGESKGGNRSNIRALQVGLRMISGIVFGWRLRSS